MLQIADLHLYYGASHVLRGVSLAAEKGRIACLLGRNGVGKTSLLRALVGLHPIRHGSITWDGRDIAHLPPHARARAGLALVPQGREIFPRLTVRENLETGFASVGARERSVPEEILALFPVLKDMLRRRGGDLSGGQQQQLAIARALVTRPRLLLLDEPTEGIQPSIIKDIARVIARLRQRGDMAILLVEQYFEFAAELADHVFVMDRGEIVLEGPRDALPEAQVQRYLTV